MNYIIKMNTKIDNMIISGNKEIKGWKGEKQYISNIRDENNNKYSFITPVMYIPFGLEKDYTNYIIKLQFKGVKDGTNQEMIEFYNMIRYFENKITDLEQNKKQFKSQIISKENYDDLLLIKINKKFFNLDIYANNGEIRNIFDIKKNMNIKCHIHIDTLWSNEEIYTTKFILDKIIIDE